jgi:hypothetical protein
MQIETTYLETNWLIEAAIYSQRGQQFTGAQKARALARRIVEQMPVGIREVASDDMRTVALDLTTEELSTLYRQVANGQQWPFADWSDSIMDTFGQLIEHMAGWVKDSQAKDTFDALPESEKRKARTLGDKEQ